MGNRYVALYLSKGRYVLAVAYDGKKIKIKSKAKYSDGQWHMVRMGCLCFFLNNCLLLIRVYQCITMSRHSRPEVSNAFTIGHNCIPSCKVVSIFLFKKRFN